MAQTQGSVVSTNTISAQLRKDMDSKIYLLEPNDAPLSLLTSSLNKKSAIQPAYNWIEHELVAETDAINYGAGYDDDDTDLVVDNGVFFAVGDIVLVPSTGELMKVGARSTNTITFARGIAGSTAAAIADNAVLYIIGNAFAEASDIPLAKMVAKAEKTGYTQIFKTTVPIISNTAEASQSLTENEIAYQKALFGKEHILKIEKSAFFGRPYVDLTGSTPVRYTGGIIPTISTNVVNAAGTLTEATWDSFVSKLCNYGSAKKVVFVSPLIANKIDGFGKGKLSTAVKDDRYGFSVRKYFNSVGEVSIIVHKKVLTGSYGGYAVGVDLEHFRMRTLRPGKCWPADNGNVDGKSWYWMSELGFQPMQEKTHALLYGVTG